MAVGGGTFQQRPDGLYDVSPAPGMPPLPLALSDQDLVAAGLSPVAPPPPMATGPAAMANAPTLQDLDRLYNEGKIDQQQYQQGLQEVYTAPPPSRLDAGGAGGAPGAVPPGPRWQDKPGFGVLSGDTTARTAPGPTGASTGNEPGAAAPKGPAAPGPAKGAQRADPNDLIQVGGAQPGAPTAPASARAVKIPAKDIRASFTRVPGVEIDPELRGALDTDTTTAHMTAGAEESRTRQLEALTTQRAALNKEIEALDQQESRRSAVNAKIARQEKLIDQRDKEAEKLKPQSAKQVWENRGAFAQMMGALSVIIGGYMQGMQGASRNPALDMLNESIDREVADQRRTWEDARDGQEEARNDFARAIAIYGTPEAAELDLRMRRLGIAENMLRSEIQAAGVEGQYHAALAEADNMRIQRGMLRQQLTEMEKGRITQENFVHVPERVVGGGVQKPKAIDRMVVLPNGQRAWARTAKAAEASQAQLTDNLALVQDAERIKQLRQGNLADPRVKEQIKTIAGRMFLQIKSAENLGTLDKGALEFREEYMGNPDALLTISAEKKLDELSVGARNRVQRTLQYDLHGDPDAVTPLVSPAPSSARSDE